jgi:hypothetical protein
MRRSVTLAHVNGKYVGPAAAILVVDAALLLIVGAAMWSEPPSAADEAVGKGLVALGTALAVPAFVILCAYLSARAAAPPAPEVVGSDWDTV